MEERGPSIAGIIGDSADGNSTPTQGLANRLGADRVMHECTDEVRNKLARREEHIRQLRFELTGLLPFAKRSPPSPELTNAIEEAELCLTTTKLFEPPYPVWIPDLTETGETRYVLENREKNIRYGTVVANREGEGCRFVVNSDFFTFTGNSSTLEGAKADVEFAIGMRDRLELPAFSTKAAAATL